MFRKRAEAINKSHFLTGVSEADGTMVCSGVGLAHSTLRVALDGLSEKGLIEIHAFTTNGVESLPRVYEVKTARILENWDTEGVKNMLSRVGKQAKNQVESLDFQPQEGGAEFQRGGCRNSAHLKDILRISNISTSVDIPEPASPASKGFFRESKSSSRRAHGCTPTLSARETAEAILNKSKERRQARASSTAVPTKRWDSKTLQALLDTARENAGGACPRIAVVSKAIGVLHKRMREHQVENVVDFFSWALSNWSIVASANRKAKAVQLRQKDTKAAHSEMHLAPNFTDLAYRFPYFYKFYLDRRYSAAQTQQAEDQKSAEVQRVVASQKAAIAQRREVVREQDQQRAERRRKDDEEFRTRRRRLYSNDDLPEYVAPEWRG